MLQYVESEQDDRRLDDINFIEERIAGRPSEPHAISKAFAATMSVRSRADPLLLAIWCSIAFR